MGVSKPNRAFVMNFPVLSPGAGFISILTYAGPGSLSLAWFSCVRGGTHLVQFLVMKALSPGNGSDTAHTTDPAP